MPEFSFDALRRYPDVEADNLFAVDASDRLILDEAAADVAAAAPGEVVVIGDHYGALTLGAIAQLGASGIRVHQDWLTGERALDRNAKYFALDGIEHFALDAALLRGARVVLMQLPRSLAALDEYCAAVARWAAPDVVLICGGRLKHMSITMNEVIGRHFESVRASLGRQKSRVIFARGPRSVASSSSALATPPVASSSSAPASPSSSSSSGMLSEYPAREYHQDLGLWVCAHGAAFAGTGIDIGTRYLLDFLPDMAPDARTAIDLGCGTGILAVALSLSRPALAVTATDDSAAAVASARATAAANGAPVEVVRDDGLSSRPDASADLIVLNPPFHVGSAVHPGIALRMFKEAARVLVPGGELWTVFNSHLTYRPALTREVGPTTQAGRNAKFTVTVSTKSR